MGKSRREKLEEFLAKNPADAFGRYGMAVECARLGDHAAAEEHFKRLLGEHPEYVAGYFQFGQMLAKLGRTEEARKALASGVAMAAKAGDEHARSEIEAALEDLGGAQESSPSA